MPPAARPTNGPTAWPSSFPPDLTSSFKCTTPPTASADEDQTTIGLVFARKPPQQRVITLQLNNHALIIPPGARDFRVEVEGTLPNDATLLSFFPHMHLRGKRFEYDIVHDDGSAEVLLRVNYHFHWQLSYKLAEPRPLKAGTRLRAIAWYDNSKNNPHNPDPEKTVTWGDQTSDEMMVGFFDVAIPAAMDKWQLLRTAVVPTWGRAPSPVQAEQGSAGLSPAAAEPMGVSPAALDVYRLGRSTSCPVAPNSKDCSNQSLPSYARPGRAKAPVPTQASPLKPHRNYASLPSCPSPPSRTSRSLADASGTSPNP